jgi:hypothetical protein
MKIIIFCCWIGTISFLSFSQAPQRMSYQAVIRNSSNELVINQTVGMLVSILQGTVDGAVVYSETQYPTSNANGLITLQVGGGNLVTGSFANIDWGNGPYFIKTETDINGGTNYTIIGTSQLLSVPYALYAENSGSSIPGPAGPQGPQGAPGPAGPQGIQGAAGTGGFTHYIGEYFGGGIIFHLWRDVNGIERGLIVDLADLSSGHIWSNLQSFWANGTISLSNGAGNSILISQEPGHVSSSAALCTNSNNGGFNDWYLPSLLEMYLLVQNIYVVNMALTNQSLGTEIHLTENYWTSSSSTDNNNLFAYSFIFGYFFTSTMSKNMTLRVRAIRSF